MVGSQSHNLTLLVVTTLVWAVCRANGQSLPVTKMGEGWRRRGRGGGGGGLLHCGGGGVRGQLGTHWQ